MEGVILQMSGVKMSSGIFINSVLSNDFSEVMHGEEIWIIPAWSNEDCTNASVWNLVVSLEHKRWGEIWLFFVGDLSFNMSLSRSEVLVD